jgi:hypothetical protein
MPVFNFNQSTNSLNLFSPRNSSSILPKLGINFGNSILGRGLNFLFGKAPGDYVKGHPGSGGQSVGVGVRNLRTLFQGGIDTISIKRWDTLRGGNSTDGQSSVKEQYPAGFTPGYAFYQNPKETYQPWKKFGDNTNILKEQGWLPYISRQSGNFGTENVGIQTIVNSLDYRKDILGKRDPSTTDFLFGLNSNTKGLEISENYDRISDSDQTLYNGLQFQKNISLQSWTHTLQDNEDPTILGFDLEIDTVTSPLFNGSCRDFIDAFSKSTKDENALNEDTSGNISEIKSRARILSEFESQFFKFFKKNTSTGDTPDKVKSYYLEKIDGLGKFGHVKNAATTSDQVVKLFTDFPNDFIKISIREDVQQNIAYLSYLYNILTRSRLEGRRIIPQNLLRFNCRIIVTEMRNYNRVMKVIGNATTQQRNLRDFGVGSNREDSYYVLSDLISKKEYNLYECEFFFNQLTHGDSISLSSQISPVSAVDVSFNYKFVSSEFHRFQFTEPKADPKDSFQYIKFNDEYFNPSEITSLDTNRAIFGENSPIGLTNSSISFLNPINDVTIFDAYPKNGFYQDETAGGELEPIKRRGLVGKFIKDLSKRVVGDVLRAGANALNREIGKRFALVNKALNERLARAGLQISLNTIQNPRNIYNPGSSLRNELANAIRGFVGRSTGRFFSKPVNTSEANNGFLPSKPGGGFVSSSLYRPIANRSINRVRGARITQPGNIYTPRRVSNFLSVTNSTNPRQNPSATRTARSNPFSL